MRLVKLNDGSTMEIKVNMLTLKLLGQNLPEFDGNLEDPGKGLEAIAKLIYVILYSNGKKISEEDALALVPVDESDSFMDIIVGFKDEVDKFQKKSQSRLSLLELTK